MELALPIVHVSTMDREACNNWRLICEETAQLRERLAAALRDAAPRADNVVVLDEWRKNRMPQRSGRCRQEYPHPV
jgi:hypothetical protein